MLLLLAYDIISFSMLRFVYYCLVKYLDLRNENKKQKKKSYLNHFIKLKQKHKQS